MSARDNSSCGCTGTRRQFLWEMGAGFTGLAVNLSLPSGVLAMSGTKLVDAAVFDPAQRVFYGLLPERWQAFATIWLEGPLKRAGGAAGNLLTMAALAWGGAEMIGEAALPVAAAWVVAGWLLWRRYPALLLEATAQRRTRGALVVVQVALATTLLVGTVLLLQSFVRLQQVPPGFSPEGVLTARVALPRGRYPDASRVREFYRRLRESLEANAEACEGTADTDRGAFAGAPTGSLCFARVHEGLQKRTCGEHDGASAVNGVAADAEAGYAERVGGQRSEIRNT